MPTETILDEIQEALERATPGEWNNGPVTPAGEVWVYASSGPIGEPNSSRTGYRAWFRLGFGRKVRDESFTAIQNMRAENAENDAKMIVLLRNNAKPLLAVVRAAVELARDDELVPCDPTCDGCQGIECPPSKLARTLHTLDPRLLGES